MAQVLIIAVIFLTNTPHNAGFLLPRKAWQTVRHGRAHKVVKNTQLSRPYPQEQVVGNLRRTAAGYVKPSQIHSAICCCIWEVESEWPIWCCGCVLSSEQVSFFTSSFLYADEGRLGPMQPFVVRVSFNVPCGPHMAFQSTLVSRYQSRLSTHLLPLLKLLVCRLISMASFTNRPTHALVLVNRVVSTILRCVSVLRSATADMFGTGVCGVRLAGSIYGASYLSSSSQNSVCFVANHIPGTSSWPASVSSAIYWYSEKFIAYSLW